MLGSRAATVLLAMLIKGMLDDGLESQAIEALDQSREFLGDDPQALAELAFIRRLALRGKRTEP